ncbi:LysR family transcriptional regulator [Pigmentiphaga litoralis]|uniref:LysR family transcriptional regulator n=1 Tax=Pigmentiphaga litoralis TaxID=516702 RepID=UPI0027E54B8E|nr:LysR family transcriptional regulator [Pigmentiphaga litoralis]
MMNFTWLNDFLTLAASGNFSRAARDCHMTQPAFSRRIRALETWLGVDLFDRSTHPVTLTDAGEWFRGVAEEITARVARVPDEARAVADASSSTLRFVATHALSLTFLPTWLRGLESHAPIGPIQLVSDVMPQCESLMLQGRAQFMLCHAHPHLPVRLPDADFTSTEVGTDVLMPVVAATAQGKPRHTLSRRSRARVPLLAYTPESGLGRIVRDQRQAALDAAGAEPVFTAHLATVLKSMALDGRGIAWLPQSLMQEELAAGRLVDAGGAEWHLPIGIRLFRHRAAGAAAAEAFWRAVVARAATRAAGAVFR